MRELPVLFNGEMVRRILSGDKTNTMRPIKSVPAGFRPGKILRDDKWRGWLDYDCDSHGGIGDSMPTPLGVPGDLLYVRETWNEWPTGTMRFAADNQHATRFWGPWRPSIHMPKRAARIWLEVLDVHVLRLHGVTGAHLLAEGIDITGMEPEGALYDFRALWDSIYAKQGLGWDANPWCWSYSFRVLSTTGRPA